LRQQNNLSIKVVDEDPSIRKSIAGETNLIQRNSVYTTTSSIIGT